MNANVAATDAMGLKRDGLVVSIVEDVLTVVTPQNNVMSDTMEPVKETKPRFSLKGHNNVS